MGTKHLPPPPPPARSVFLGRLLPLDAALSLHLYRLASPIPRSILLFLELSGDGRFFFPAVLSLLLFPLSPSSAAARRPLLAALLLGGLLDLLLVGLAKHLVRRPRPAYNSGMHLAFAVDHWSFPSGHSSRVFLVASFLSLSSDLVVAAFCGPAGPADLAGRIVCAWAAATSASRVLLGRHFVLDVVAGACLGVLEGLLVFYLLKRLDFELMLRHIYLL